MFDVFDIQMMGRFYYNIFLQRLNLLFLLSWSSQALLSSYLTTLANSSNEFNN